MASYDRRYDFGLRGYHQTTRPMSDDRYARGRYGYRYTGPTDERAYPDQRLANRVTSRYNRDYVSGPMPSRYDRSYEMDTGDRPDRMGGEYLMRRPYWTVGGTRTMRGSSFPAGYDYPDYRPGYGGRYPDGF